jgi:branched-chain amino acid transport system permease protein
VLPQSSSWLHIDLTGSRFLIYGVILVMMMLFRPEGLLPSRQRKAELHAADDDATAGAREQELYAEASP